MNIFVRVFIITLTSFLFSCARREQALYQKSQYEHFTRASEPTAMLTPSSQSLLDTTQVSATPNPEVSDVSASVRMDAISSRPEPAWKSHSSVVRPIEKTTINQPEIYQRKNLTRTSTLKRSVIDRPGRVNGSAIASLVFGLVGLGLFAIIFGAIGLARIRKNSDLRGRGLAIAGLILGIVGTVIAVAYAVNH